MADFSPSFQIADYVFCLLLSVAAAKKIDYVRRVVGKFPGSRSLSGLKPGPLAVLVGPEGGFAPEERELLHRLPALVPISLGPRILRADTAAIAALALVQAALGDLA